MKSPIFISVAMSQTLAYAMRPLIQCSTWHDVAVYGPPFAGTHCDDRWRDGQLTCMAGYIHSEVVCSPITVTHPCTMWAWCRLEWRCWLRLSSYMCDVDFNNNTHKHTLLMALCPGVPGQAGTIKVKPRFYWSKRHWVTAASAGPYASLHLAPDR